MASHECRVHYREIHGRLEFKEPRPPGADIVVLSNIDAGVETSPGAEALSVRYVARGCENYRIAGRSRRVEAGQVMFSSHETGSEAEAGNYDRAGTLGLCTLIYAPREELAWAQTPLILAADCTPVGPLLRDHALALWKANGGKAQIADRLIGALRNELSAVRQTILGQAAAIEAAKTSTRFEMVRRAYSAQSYLHATKNRSVDLGELAAAVGTSPFRLLTAFQQCFGETPASYHRKLRLNLALEEARRRGVPISSVADEFGFAGASSFSHAYRRAFGHAPVWEKAAS